MTCGPACVQGAAAASGSLVTRCCVSVWRTAGHPSTAPMLLAHAPKGLVQPVSGSRRRRPPTGRRRRRLGSLMRLDTADSSLCHSGRAPADRWSLEAHMAVPAPPLWPATGPGTSASAPRLLDAVRAVGSDLELPVVLQHLVEAAVTLIQAEYGALGVWGPSASEFDLLRSRHRSCRDRRYPRSAARPLGLSQEEGLPEG